MVVAFSGGKNDASGRIFCSGLYRDDINSRWILLKRKLVHLGHEVVTLDQIDFSPDILIYVANLPRLESCRKGKVATMLILSESEYIRPDNYKSEYHNNFDIIFTWKSELIDNRKYFPLYYAQHLEINAHINDRFLDRKLLVNISSHKEARPTGSNFIDLYERREKIIDWFELNHPEEFDLYGIAWDRYPLNSRKLILKVLERLPLISRKLYRIFYGKRHTYMGEVIKKAEVLEQYRFCLCFENVFGIKDYISEKIFDCFNSRVVPIYYGAPNITDYIPRGCFIDFREFASIEEMFRHIKSMKEPDYNKYIANIDTFLKSPGVRKFSDEYFIEQILKRIDDYSKY